MTRQQQIDEMEQMDQFCDDLINELLGIRCLRLGWTIYEQVGMCVINDSGLKMIDIETGKIEKLTRWQQLKNKWKNWTSLLMD